MTGLAAEAIDLAFRFPDAASDTLHGVNWSASAGSVVLVVGPSGGGKSTFLRCLNGLVPHFHGGRFGGSVVVGGRDTRQAGPRELARTVGSVFQDPEAQFVTDRVDDEIVFGLESFGVEPRAMRVRLEDMLDLLGIAHLRERDVATLSGGERQRVAIAAALATTPDLLLLDEPTSQLDPLAALDVLGAAERLNADLGLTVVIAEHRLDRVIPFASEIVRLAPHTFESGPTAQMLARLAEAPPLVAFARQRGWAPLPRTVRDARAFLPPDRGPVVIPRVRRPVGDVLIRASGVHFAYERRAVVRDVTFEGREGEVVALMGRNGSGKTTLLRMLAGLARPARGEIAAGRPLAAHGKRPTHAIALDIGFVPQHPSSILHQETVRAELEFTLRSLGRKGHVDATLADLGIGEVAERNPLDLSGGERQRVALAALAVGQPAVLLLDEPTRGLPASDKRALSTWVRAYAAGGRLVVVATHDVDFVAESADRVVLLADGEVVADGTPDEVLAGSLAFAPQLQRLLGGNVLTLADATLAAERWPASS